VVYVTATAVLPDRHLTTTSAAPFSYCVAWKKKAFGEGAERLAFKFRFLVDDSNRFVGPVMVAKESRYVSSSPKRFRVFLTAVSLGLWKTLTKAVNPI
jgi:hypothetical protein